MWNSNDSFCEMNSDTAQDSKLTNLTETTPKLTPQRATRKRTPLSGFKKVNSSFKSPVQTSNMATSAVSPEEEIRELQIKLCQMDSEIAELENEGIDEEELDQHIDLLHEYNDIKDIGQTLLGRLAGLRGVTTRDLYSHFGMELDD